MTRRYLPLERPDGSWIERRDLFLLARLSYEDDQDETVVGQLYETMLRANNTSEKLNVFESDIEKRHLRRNLRYRKFTGSVVQALVRIAATQREPPSLSQGFRLVAFNQQRHEDMKASEDSLLREVRKGFSLYRSTAHLQAAAVMGNPSLYDIEASEVHTTAFLARARGFEGFIDNNVVSEAVTWNPWRVPEAIAPLSDIKVRRLTAEEISAAGAD